MKHLFATAAVVAGLMVAGSASASVVLSQDFNGIDIHAAGFNPASPGFETEYAFRTGSQNTPDHVNSMYDEGTWTIAQNPFDSHNLWRNEDLGSNALILNGKNLPAGDPNSTAWAQTANGVAAGHYTYSFDAYDVCCNANFDPANNAASLLTLSYSLNGGPTITAATVNTSTTTFEDPTGSRHYHVTGGFNLGQSGNLKVSLLNWAGAPGGNDFAVDNISVAGVPEPASWALMLVGFGGLGAMLRASRRRMATATAS